MKKCERKRAMAFMHAFSSWIFIEHLNVPSMILGDSFIAVNKKRSSIFYGAYTLVGHEV